MRPEVSLLAVVPGEGTRGGTGGGGMVDFGGPLEDGPAFAGGGSE